MRGQRKWLEKAELAHEVLGREDDWLCRPTANETLHGFFKDGFYEFLVRGNKAAVNPEGIGSGPRHSIAQRRDKGFVPRRRIRRGRPHPNDRPGRQAGGGLLVEHAGQ
jgi:hypothetical protein